MISISTCMMMKLSPFDIHSSLNELTDTCITLGLPRSTLHVRIVEPCIATLMASCTLNTCDIHPAQYQHIVFPICHSSHWILGVWVHARQFHTHRPRFYIFDSLYMLSQHEVATIAHHISSTLGIQQGTYDIHYIPLGIQRNATDCGVYIMLWARILIQQKRWSIQRIVRAFRSIPHTRIQAIRHNLYRIASMQYSSQQDNVDEHHIQSTF